LITRVRLSSGPFYLRFIRNHLANGQSRWRSAGPCQTVGKALSENYLANGQSRWRSAGPCQTVGKAFSGFALPTALIFL